MSTEPFASPHLRQLLSRYPDLGVVGKEVEAAAACLCECARVGGKLLVCGNGGSGSDADHIVGELVKGFVLPRPLLEAERGKIADTFPGEDSAWLGKLQRGMAAIALGAHGALVTAIANDNDPRLIYAQQVFVYARPGDVLLVLSSSGESPNILFALRVARGLGIKTIGMTGAQPASMDRLSDILIKVPARGAVPVQEFHLPIYHTLCLIVEAELFG